MTDDFTPGEIHVGLRCMAPIKKLSSGRRELQEVEVTWVSKDGFVVAVETRPKSGQRVYGSFACSHLERLVGE